MANICSKKIRKAKAENKLGLAVRLAVSNYIKRLFGSGKRKEKNGMSLLIEQDDRIRTVMGKEKSSSIHSLLWSFHQERIVQMQLRRLSLENTKLVNNHCQQYISAFTSQ